MCRNIPMQMFEQIKYTPYITFFCYQGYLWPGSIGINIEAIVQVYAGSWDI